MAKILINGEWFNEVSPSALYESEFENIITSQAQYIFTEYYVCPFKTEVYTDEDIVKPDLALIDKKYRGWWVVEVEMSYHSFDNHILPQVLKLSRGIYGASQANYICSQLEIIDRDKAFDLMKGKQPQILVVVNKPMLDWQQALRRFDTKLCVVEIFRSDQNKHVFRVNGDYPKLSEEFITDCHFDPLLPRFMNIDSPASLSVKPGEYITLLYENCVTVWQRIDCIDRVWLSPKSLNPLSKKQKYTINKQNDGTYAITPKI